MKKLALIFGLMLAGLPACATVVSQNISATFTCTGTAGPFAFTFSVSAANAITVNQNGTVLSPTTYVVTPVNNNYDNGGSVTLNAACPNAQTLTITRTTPLTQSTVFTDNMPVPMKSFENGLDKLTEIAQELGATKGGTGSVNSVAVANANGFQGTVLNPNTNPTITISVDSTHVLPTNTGNGSTFLNSAGTYSTLSGGGLPSGSQYQLQTNGGSSLFGHTNAYTDATGNPLTVPGDLAGKRTNSVGNTDLYATGAGNNGIANFFSTFTQGVATVPPGSTDTESFTTPIPEQSILFDYRKNQITRTFHSTGQNTTTNSPQCGNSGSIQSGNGICDVYDFDLPNTAFTSYSKTTNVNSPGFNFGSPATTSANGWTVYFTDFNTDFFNTRGIKEDFAANIHDNAVGDFAASAMNVDTNGGATEPSSEGAELFSWHITENTSYFHGTCSSGCTTGSSSLVTTHTSGNNAFTDGSFLLDTTQSPLTTTVSSIAYPNGFMAYNFGTGVLTTSTAWATITATTNPPNFQTPVSQTVTATLNVGGTNSPGPFVVGNNACLVGAPGGSGGFMEQAQITAVGTATTTQSVTFNSRYGYNDGSLLMQGSACGYYVTSNTSWQPAAMVIGAFSPTQAVIGACLGACTETAASSLTDMVKTEVGDVGATVNLYQGAEIIGTNKGTANNVQLATNTVPFAVNDVLIDPHPLAVLESAGVIQIAQTTPINDRFGAMLELAWSGPAAGNNMYDAFYNANVNALYTGNTPNSSTYAYYLENNHSPTQAAIYLPANTGYYLHLTGNNSIYSLANSGGYIFGDRTTNGLVPLQALNVPTTPTVLGQIPIASTLSNLAQNYTATTVSGDATISSTGVVTVAKINGVSVTGTPSAGQTIVATGPTTATWQTPNIPNVQIVLPVTTLAANTCSAVITTTMTGVTTTSTFTSAFASDASGVTGYGSSGGLSIVMWPTANTNNLKLCNPTAASITPGAMTINVGVR